MLVLRRFDDSWMTAHKPLKSMDFRLWNRFRLGKTGQSRPFLGTLIKSGPR
jgi:hypothetical protein